MNELLRILMEHPRWQANIEVRGKAYYFKLYVPLDDGIGYLYVNRYISALEIHFAEGDQIAHELREMEQALINAELQHAAQEDAEATTP